MWAWGMDLLPADLSAHVALLDDADQQRMHRFHFAPDRARYALAHANMRRILSAYLAQSPEAISFREGAFGKPELAGADRSPMLSFNLSHSKTIAALVVCRSGPVGIDVEDVRAIEPEVAASHFSAAELADLDQVKGDEWLESFYRCWTRKEAILKAEGVGLHHPLDGFDVSLLPDAPPALLGTRIPLSHRWHVYDVSPAMHTIGALATAQHCAQLSLYSYLP